MTKVKGEWTVPTTASGFIEASRNPTSRKIAIVFDDETFDQIKAVAIEERRSFAAIVRELCEMGLEDRKRG